MAAIKSNFQTFTKKKTNKTQSNQKSTFKIPFIDLGFNGNNEHVIFCPKMTYGQQNKDSNMILKKMKKNERMFK